MPGSAAQPNFFSVNFRDLLPAQSQDEPAVYELGNITSLSYFTNFLALIESGAPEVGCKTERDTFMKTMTYVFASGRHSKMDARLITLLLATEWVQLDVLAVIKQLTINEQRTTRVTSALSSLFSLGVSLSLSLSQHRTAPNSTEQHQTAPNSTKQHRTAPNSAEQHRC